MPQFKVSGFASEYTLFQNFWVIDAKTDEDAIEQVAQSLRRHYSEDVVEHARQELHATELTQAKETTNAE